MRYLTPDELLYFYDKRRVLELVSDTSSSELEGNISTNAIVLTAITSASSEFDAAVQQGGLYTRATIEDIISNAGTITDDTAAAKRAFVIKKIVADLAFYYLVTRRGYGTSAANAMAPAYEDAQRFLQELTSGRRVLDIDSAVEAGKPNSVYIGRDAPVSPLSVNRLFGVWNSSDNINNLWGR